MSRDTTDLLHPAPGVHQGTSRGTQAFSPPLSCPGVEERQGSPRPPPLMPRCLAQVVRYEAGYVVCAVIAGLYLLLVPTTGLCFCCCRCRRRCGGRVKTEHKAMACERGTLMSFLLLTTLMLL